MDSNINIINELKQQIVEKDKQIKQLLDIIEKYNTLDEAITLITENSKALSLSKKLKTEPRVNMHGEEHPRYRNDIDNDSLVADYQAGMILKDLSNKYKISIPGVRNRLIDLGVYKQVYNNGINIAELTKDYCSGMKLQDLSDKHGISISSVRNKLIEHGVYKKD